MNKKQKNLLLIVLCIISVIFFIKEGSVPVPPIIKLIIYMVLTVSIFGLSIYNPKDKK
ncbi:MAG: hypothetical protein IKK66_08765 [Ruminococcus sp.]|nr:hypothetical protein [Ruminococcus sp.]